MSATEKIRTSAAVTVADYGRSATADDERGTSPRTDQTTVVRKTSRADFVRDEPQIQWRRLGSHCHPFSLTVGGQPASRRVRLSALPFSGAVFLCALFAPSSTPAAQSIEDRAFSRHPYEISVPRRTVDEMAEIAKANLARTQFSDVYKSMMSRQIAVPLRKDGAIWHSPFIHGNINYLLPSPYGATEINGILAERLPIYVECAIERIAPGTRIRCRVGRAYLGSGNRWLNVQRWHKGHDVPPGEVQSRFQEIFEKLKHEPASRK